MGRNEVANRLPTGGSVAGMPRPILRDPLTLAGAALWLAGTAVGISAAWDEPVRLFAAVAGLGGLVVWVASAFRASLRGSSAGSASSLASIPAVIALGIGSVAAVVLLVAAIALWAAP